MRSPVILTHTTNNIPSDQCFQTSRYLILVRVKWPTKIIAKNVLREIALKHWVTYVYTPNNAASMRHIVKITCNQIKYLMISRQYSTTHHPPIFIISLTEEYYIFTVAAHFTRCLTYVMCLSLCGHSSKSITIFNNIFIFNAVDNFYATY